MALTTNNSEAIRIDASGNVGIGTDSLTGGRKLHVFDAGDCNLRVETTTASFDARLELIGDSGGVSQIRFGDEVASNIGLLTYDHTTDSMAFTANASERMRINSSGNVGIGTSSPASIVGGTDTSPVLSIGGSDSTLILGDKAGSVSFITNDGSYSTTFPDGVTGEIASISETGVGGAYGMAFYTGTTSGTNRGERLRIDASGNVGIGTEAPASPFHLTTGVDGNALQINGASNAWEFMVKSGPSAVNDFPYSIGLYRDDGATPNGVINFGRGSTTNNGHMTFDVNSVEAMRVDASGNVRINNTDAGNYRLKIAYLGSGEEGIGLQTTYAGTSNMIRFLNSSGASVGLINSTTSSTAYNTTSDYRLKENITPVQGASDIVKAMRPVTYNFKADSTDWHDGFLAHELQELHPRAVVGEKDAMVDEEYEVTPAVYEDVVTPAVEAVAEVPAVYDDEGVLVSEMVPAVEAQLERTEQRLVTEAVMGTRSVPDHQGVDYSKLTPILTAALQEALNKIDALEARLAALEAM
jgi:hypothetical protein